MKSLTVSENGEGEACGFNENSGTSHRVSVRESCTNPIMSSPNQEATP